MYILYDKTSGDYVCRADNGSYGVCRSLGQSALFSTERGAQNIVNNGGVPKVIAKKHNFSIARVGTKGGKASHIIVDAVEPCVSKFDYSTPEEIRKAADYLGRVMENSVELGTNLSIVDKEISDIQHYIETMRLNAAQRSHAFKLLRDKLNERRLYKNLLDISTSMNNDGLTHKHFANAVASVEGLETKQYAPRSTLGETLFNKQKTNCT